MGAVRSAVLGRILAPAAGQYRLHQVLAGQTALVKTVTCQNLDTLPNLLIAWIAAGDGSGSATLINETFEASAFKAWSGWHVMAPNDVLWVYCAGTFMAYASGTVLDGSVPVAPAVGPV